MLLLVFTCCVSHYSLFYFIFGCCRCYYLFHSIFHSIYLTSRDHGAARCIITWLLLSVGVRSGLTVNWQFFQVSLFLSPIDTIVHQLYAPKSQRITESFCSRSFTFVFPAQTVFRYCSSPIWEYILESRYGRIENYQTIKWNPKKRLSKCCSWFVCVCVWIVFWTTELVCIYNAYLGQASEHTLIHKHTYTQRKYIQWQTLGLLIAFFSLNNFFECFFFLA